MRPVQSAASSIGSKPGRSVYTGLRISDVATFHTGRLNSAGECHVRTTKTGRKVSTWIPEWLQARIRERETQHGPLVFGERDTDDINVITDTWPRKLNRLWDLCGPWKERPTPHRFRHTFARFFCKSSVSPSGMSQNCLVTRKQSSSSIMLLLCPSARHASPVC